jgi:hypothetical protein
MGRGRFASWVLVASIVLSGIGVAVAAQPSEFFTRQQIDAEVMSVDPDASEVRLKTDAGRFTPRGRGAAALKPGMPVVMPRSSGTENRRRGI